MVDGPDALVAVMTVAVVVIELVQVVVVLTPDCIHSACSRIDVEDIRHLGVDGEEVGVAYHLVYPGPVSS
jgi:hypothetical protein